MRDVERLYEASNEEIRRGQWAQEDVGRIVQGRRFQNRVNDWQVLKRSRQRKNRVQRDNRDVSPD